jgi:hypothetical protein
MKRLVLRPGQALEWTAEKSFTLSMGDAGAITLSLDGQELPPLGKVGQMALNVRLPSPRGSLERQVRNAERLHTTKPRCASHGLGQRCAVSTSNTTLSKLEVA